MLHRVIDFVVLIAAVLCVPFTHGTREYAALIIVGILVVALNHGIARRRRRGLRSS